VKRKQENIPEKIKVKLDFLRGSEKEARHIESEKSGQRRDGRG